MMWYHWVLIVWAVAAMVIIVFTIGANRLDGDD